MTQALDGFEPSISCLRDRRINHYATKPWKHGLEKNMSFLLNIFCRVFLFKFFIQLSFCVIDFNCFCFVAFILEFVWEILPPPT